MARIGNPRTGRWYIPTDSFTVNVDGLDRIYRMGEGPYPDDDPVVKMHPHLFRELLNEDRVEEATARPGEMRQ